MHLERLLWDHNGATQYAWIVPAGGLAQQLHSTHPPHPRFVALQRTTQGAEPGASARDDAGTSDPLSATDRARLDRLQAAGLFTGLHGPVLEGLHGRAQGAEDVLSAIIDLYEIYRKDERDPLVRCPQGIVGVPASVRAVMREQSRTLTVGDGEHARAFECRSHHDYARALDAGLAQVGDARRFVPLQVVDWEEPLFLLCTPAQAELVGALGLVDVFAE